MSSSRQQCSGACSGVVLGCFRVLDARFASRDAVKATLGSFSCWIQWKQSQWPETLGESAKFRSSRTHARAKLTHPIGPKTGAKRCAVAKRKRCTLGLVKKVEKMKQRGSQHYTAESYFKIESAQFAPRWWWWSGSVTAKRASGGPNRP